MNDRTKLVEINYLHVHKDIGVLSHFDTVI